MQTLCVVTGSLLLTGWCANSIPMTAAYQDRIGLIRSQDEATYSRVALEMALRGDWMTPHLLGRFFLYKPPLLYWLSGAAVRLFGISRFALRLPSVLAGAMAAGVLFLWCSELRTWIHGLTAAVLLLSNAPWEAMSRLVCMDALLAFWILLALYFVARDPSLRRLSSAIGFGLATGAAILTKSVAGLVPLFAAAIILLVLRDWRPSVNRMLITAAAIAVACAPWHIYQLAVHPEWFLMEYIRAQLFGFGVHPPAQSSAESQLWFYAKRLFLTDPVLVVCTLAAAAPLSIGMYRREPNAWLTGSWLAVVIVLLSAFQARSFLYAILLIPPMCIASAAYFPISDRYRLAFLLVLAAIGLAKIPAHAPWDLNFARIKPTASHYNLLDYAARQRPNELILVETDDEFYSMLLPLHGIRYCLVDTTRAAERYAPHLAALGITMDADRFIHLDRYRADYTAKLTQKRLYSTEALGTSIEASSREELLALVQASPDRDFYLPQTLADFLRTQTSATHAYAKAQGNRAFLFALRAPATIRPSLLPYPPSL